MALFTETRRLLAAATLMAAAASSPAAANPDLLVAPTRVVLENQRGAEVILNNIGPKEATYRISLELKRMTGDGRLEEVDPAQATERERQALAMISYAPRRATLAPGQPQAIRIGVRAPDDLPDGEYRVHMMFQGIPEVAPVTDAPVPGQGVSIALTPIYGISIPIIVRKGQLSAAAALSDVKMTQVEGAPALSVDLARSGDRSIFGQLRVRAPGADEPLFQANGIAVYDEIGAREIVLPLDPEVAAKLHGPVTVEYLENRDGTLTPLASTQATLP